MLAFFSQILYFDYSYLLYPLQFIAVIGMAYSYWQFSLAFSPELNPPVLFRVRKGIDVFTALILAGIVVLLLFNLYDNPKTIQPLLAYPVFLFVITTLVFHKKRKTAYSSGDSELAKTHTSFFYLTLSAIGLGFTTII